MRKIVLILAFIAITLQCMALTPVDYENKAKKLFTSIEATADDSIKIALSKQLQEVMVCALRESGDFYLRFNTLNRVGDIMSSDESVHLYSWNILLTDGTCHYYAIFHHREDTTIIPISSTSSYTPSLTDTVYADNWYGSIYYEIHPIEYRNQGTAYLVFGVMLPKGMPYRQKVAEIIRFTDNGIAFGDASIIYPGREKRHTRLLFEYAANSNIALEYNPKRKTLYFDHLSPAYVTPSGITIYGPDMSVDAFVFKRNKWKFKDDVRARNKPERKSK